MAPSHWLLRDSAGYHASAHAERRNSTASHPISPCRHWMRTRGQGGSITAPTTPYTMSSFELLNMNLKDKNIIMIPASTTRQRLVYRRCPVALYTHYQTARSDKINNREQHKSSGTEYFTQRLHDQNVVQYVHRRPRRHADDRGNRRTALTYPRLLRSVNHAGSVRHAQLPQVGHSPSHNDLRVTQNLLDTMQMNQQPRHHAHRTDRRTRLPLVDAKRARRHQRHGVSTAILRRKVTDQHRQLAGK